MKKQQRWICFWKIRDKVEVKVKVEDEVKVEVEVEVEVEVKVEDVSLTFFCDFLFPIVR
ncbi:MAG: hypothetical protein PWQ17_2581 [Anaerophaga sp.]|nr:hypothetical protein [Anaerophaga sp.]